MTISNVATVDITGAMALFCLWSISFVAVVHTDVNASLERTAEVDAAVVTSRDERVLTTGVDSVATDVPWTQERSVNICISG